MFSAFFYRLTLCQPFALYVLREEEKITMGQQVRENNYVGFDPEYINSQLIVRE
jgi:hypothetical protein